MATREDFGDFETAWCPGCGNFSIREALIRALVQSGLEPHGIVMVSGIGQAAKMPHYLRCHGFNGLHGRSVPAATGIALANHGLKVIVSSGDGCNYGEGGNHFLAALRRNIDITLLVHDNQIYGLTKGQASPTSQQGMVTKAQPDGQRSRALNPVATAVANKVSFVARGFAGDKEQLADLIKQAMAHKGFSLIDIMQPCVSFNKVNTWSWYQERCRPLPAEHDPTDWHQALKQSDKFGEVIPTGVIYRNEERKPFSEHFDILVKGPLYGQGTDYDALKQVMLKYA
jgi:2-oxoglutarate ferredoxin oxidoreductase subunit beta